MRRRDLLAAAALVGLAGPVGAQTDKPPPELITYESDGKSIRAVVFRPRGAPRNAGVVFLHGSGGIGGIQLAFAERFADDGYLVIVPTYLDAAADDVVRPEPVMAAWRKCGADAVEWLIGQGIEPRRTGVIGYSLGSYISVDGSLGDSRAAATIALAGGWDVYIPRRPRRRIPVLIIRCERDRVVSASSTARWADFLRAEEVPVRVQVIRGAGHLMNQAQWREAFERATGFFGETIGARQSGQS